MKSPFKFLDSFTLADKDSFFGREKEEKTLFRLVHKTKLVIVYGFSGTGKTSLIQCGLARQFEGPDWLPIFIRRKNDINTSINHILSKLLPEDDKSSQDIHLQINKIYRKYYRPVYLIFDQFEELFIFGEKPERDLFITQIKKILTNECPCSIIITIREEYLGQMYVFEKAIPSFFDYRLRIEHMSTETVRKTLDASFKRFNITVENPPQIKGEKVDKYDSILKNVNGDKTTIDLPFLQVYLDRFYKQDFKRTYPNQENTEGEWLPIEFTQQEIADFGTIEKILDDFLDDQFTVIQEKLSLNDHSISRDMARSILNTLVSDEGTKRPIRIIRKGNNIAVNPDDFPDFPVFDAGTFTRCIQSFESARLIRVNDETMELAHDSLAKIINSKRTDDEILLNDIRKLIGNAHRLFRSVPEYLSNHELNIIENYKDRLNLNADLQRFVEKSQTAREKEQYDKEAKLQEDLEKEKHLKDEAMRQKDIAEKQEKKTQRQKRRVQLVALLASIFLMVAIYGLDLAQKNEQEAKNKRAEADQRTKEKDAALIKLEQANKEVSLSFQEVKSVQKEKVSKEIDILKKRAENLKKEYPELAKEKLINAKDILYSKGYLENDLLEDKRKEINDLLNKF